MNILSCTLFLKEDNFGGHVLALETEIDQLVYELYGLMDEEIAIVEESVGQDTLNLVPSPRGEGCGAERDRMRRPRLGKQYWH